TTTKPLPAICRLPLGAASVVSLRPKFHADQPQLGASAGHTLERRASRNGRRQPPTQASSRQERLLLRCMASLRNDVVTFIEKQYTANARLSVMSSRISSSSRTLENCVDAI
ncbi:acetyl-coenzyme A carboxylase carboxyltransferase subunits beta/alpha, partial [Striga asiatica]